MSKQQLKVIKQFEAEGFKLKSGKDKKGDAWLAGTDGHLIIVDWRGNVLR